MILHQVHGHKIVVVDHKTPKLKQTGDGMITNIPGRLLAVKTADCIPLFLCDKRQKVVGILHVGWRGADQGIHNRAIHLLKTRFHSSPQDIIVGIGPGICKECYTFPQKPSQSWGQYVYQQKMFWHVDLKGFIKSELLALGIKPTNIEDMQICTYEDKRLPSHRRSIDTGEPEGRIISSIRL